MHNRVTFAAAVVAVGIGAGAALVVTNAAPSAHRAVSVVFTDTACGDHDGWNVSAGQTTFSVTSHAAAYSAVYLEDSAGDVVAEVPSIGHGTTTRVPTTLTGGTYRFRCILTDATVLRSAPVRVTGRAAAAHGYRPMRSMEMAGPVKAYTAWVGSRLPGLVDACRTLDADVARGDLAAARTDWLSAHLAYESLGAAYTAFGSFDASINSRADGLPQGTATPEWTGFLAVEHALWSGRSAAQVRPLTQRLVADTSGLQKEWRSDEIDPGDMPLRTHEILENALQFQLTGDADYGSGTTLATTYANTQGTAELLATLAGQLAKLAPHVLSDARTQLATVQADLLAQRDSHGRWTPAASLTAAARSKLDADLGALLETLAQLPPTVDPRNGA